MQLAKLNCAFAIVAILALSPIAAFAQQATPAAAEDPGIVISRTVMPRTAYRGIPVEDNPIHVRATTFPENAFSGALNASLEDLGDTNGSAGLIVDATQGVLLNGPLATGGNGLGLLTSGTGIPLGGGASSAGMAGGAVQSIGPTVTNAISTALGAMPSGNTGAGP